MSQRYIVVQKIYKYGSTTWTLYDCETRDAALHKALKIIESNCLYDGCNIDGDIDENLDNVRSHLEKGFIFAGDCKINACINVWITETIYDKYLQFDDISDNGNLMKTFRSFSY